MICNKVFLNQIALGYFKTAEKTKDTTLHICYPCQGGYWVNKLKKLTSLVYKRRTLKILKFRNRITAYFTKTNKQRITFVVVDVTHLTVCNLSKLYRI